jgi:hypothetical protein
MYVTSGPFLLHSFPEISDAIVYNAMPGEFYSQGLMNVLFGRANPGGKLTFTMPNVDNEQRMSVEQFPGADGGWNST